MNPQDHPRMTAHVSQNYMPIPETGCWLWLGSWDQKKYGRLASSGRRRVIVSRLFYEAYYGPIPAGMFICHKCDTPPCCNPDHLFAGTNLENARDMAQKNRARKATGEFNSAAKLTEGQVAEIRADRRFQREIAVTYGISRSLVSMIKNRKLWAHIDKGVQEHG